MHALGYLIATVKHTTTLSLEVLNLAYHICMLFSCGATSTLDHMRGRGLRTKLLRNIEAVLQEHELVCSVMIVLEGVVHQVLLTYYKGNFGSTHFVSQHHCLPAEVIRNTDSRMALTQTPMCMEDVIA